MPRNKPHQLMDYGENQLLSTMLKPMLIFLKLFLKVYGLIIGTEKSKGTKVFALGGKSAIRVY